MKFRSMTAIGLALALAACAVGPDFEKPKPPAVEGYTPEPLETKTAASDVQGGAAQHFAVGQDIPGEWWTLFRSPALNTLVTEALQHNPDLEAAQASLSQAQQNVAAAEGGFFPTVNGGANYTRQKATGAAFGLPGGSTIYSVATASLNVSYSPDIFGGTRRTVEATEAQADYQRYQLEAAYLTLTSNVVIAAITEAGLRGEIAATEEIIKADADLLKVLQGQFQLGAVSRSAVLQQQTLLAQAKANLPPLHKQLEQQRNRIAALAGRFPTQPPGQTFDLDKLTLPEELPLSVPSTLVQQRPDVQAAEATLHQASAQIGVATANMFPQFPISASIGSTAAQIGSLFAAGSGVWSIAAGITQPIFRGGTLLAQKRAAEAAYDAASAQYRGTVIGAVQNVADALRALQADADAVQARLASAQSASDALNLVQEQYKLGAVDFLTLLNAQTTYQQNRIALVQSQANRYSDTAALFQALGGGWWNRTDVASRN